MDDPTVPGPFTFKSVVYAAPGLAYPAPALGQFGPFEHPAPGFETRTIDLADLADFDASYPWPFDHATAPINGLLRVPDGPGPFPLALFAHGNHDAAENSTPGYLYLCELLASHGILAASIDVNFLNGSNFGENAARAVVHLEHVRQFKLWNGSPGHPLSGKVDLTKVMIVGHSRGGEAVGHASAINRAAVVRAQARTAPPVPLDGSAGLGPYGFALAAVVAIAPTDQQYVAPVGGGGDGRPAQVLDDYVVIHGTRDGDVYTFEGHLAHDRSHRVDMADPAKPAAKFKALAWVHNATHNQFNTAWPTEYGPAAVATMPRGDQERVAKAYLGAVARARLLGQAEYLGLLADPDVATAGGWVAAGTRVVSQYQPPDRLYILHAEETDPDPQIAPPLAGSVTATGLTAAKRSLNFAAASSHLRGLGGGFLDPSRFLLQDARGVRIEWAGGGGGPPGRYVLRFDLTGVPVDRFTHVAFRAGQSAEPSNPAGADQDFTVVFRDGSASATLPVSSLRPLPYPDPFPTTRPVTRFRPHTDPVAVLQTVLVPFAELRDRGVDPFGLREIEFRFDRTPTGVVYLDDVQLTRI